MDNTIIVITSDHGEEFLEHGRIKHGMHLYDETIRVPLIIWTPKLLKGYRITEQVETVDIYPTVCKILDIETPNVIQGESLFPWTRVKSNPYAYSHTEHAYIRGKKGRISKSSIRTNEWKLISTPSENKYELYSIKDDRDESSNIFGKHPIGDALRSKLEEWVLMTNKNVPETRTGIDKETMKKLRSLGYIR
ncbi:MAG: sulfatase-like hydrolase/transferase [Bacteroidetes bacterium]|nr:sulfatase-like hydrolase/transferase [Bacteroidota bacterium]